MLLNYKKYKYKIKKRFPFFVNFVLNIPRYLRYKKNFYLSKGKLPDFIIIGAQKSGTSSLFCHINKHPMIEMCPNFIKIRNCFEKGKEICFFDIDSNWNKGEKWYKAMFNNCDKLQGEATPNYIFIDKYHKRMFKTIPKAKLILILRNPVDRAYSSYNHQVQENVSWGGLDTSKSFSEIINKTSMEDLKKTYLISMGLYIKQIKMLLKYFKRDQLLILISEEMKNDPQKVYNKVFDFLGVPRKSIEYNSSIHKRKYSSYIEESARIRLNNIYKEYNEELFNFLGYRIKDWE